MTAVTIYSEISMHVCDMYFCIFTFMWPNCDPPSLHWDFFCEPTIYFLFRFKQNIWFIAKKVYFSHILDVTYRTELVNRLDKLMHAFIGKYMKFRSKPTCHFIYLLAVAHPPNWIHPIGIERLIHIAPYGIERPAQNFTQWWFKIKPLL